MTKSQCLTGLLLIVSFLLQAQSDPDTTYWQQGGISSLTFSQVSLSNWASGGQNSVALNAAFTVFADKTKANHKWKNSLDLGYGIVQQDDRAFQKADDRINLVTNYSLRINRDSDKWFYTGLLDFKTQFADGFAPEDSDSLISTFLAPGYLVIGSGIEYAPAGFLTLTYIPVTGKMTFVTDPSLSDIGAYGVDSGKTVRAELGSSFRLVYKQEPLQNVNIDSRLELFTNYSAESFGNIDVNWQNTVILKVNKYLSTNIFTQLLYDDDIKIEVDKNNDGLADERGPRIQFKSVIGVGLSWQFGAQRATD